MPQVDEFDDPKKLDKALVEAEDLADLQVEGDGLYTRKFYDSSGTLFLVRLKGIEGLGNQDFICN